MDWRQDAIDLMRAVCPDADGLEIRIAEPAELGLVLPDGVGGFYGAAGYALAGCDPSECLLVCVDGSRFSTWQERVGAVAHEVAHWLDAGPPRLPAAVLKPTSEWEAMLLELQTRALAAVAVKRIEAVPIGEDTLPRWHQHGHNFVRCGAILAYRVGQLVEAIRPHHLRFSQDYTNVSEPSWFAPLAAEIEQPGAIGAILATDPPEPFKQAWRSITGEVLQ